MEIEMPDFAVFFNGACVAIADALFLEEIVKRCPPGGTIHIEHESGEPADIVLDQVMSTRATNKMAVQVSDWAAVVVGKAKQSCGCPAGEPGVAGPAGVSLPPDEPLKSSCPVPAPAPPVEKAVAQETPASPETVVTAPPVNLSPDKQIAAIAAGNRQLLQPGTMVKTKLGRKYCVEAPHLLPVGAEVLPFKPHEDHDYTYVCGKPDCVCVQNLA